MKQYNPTIEEKLLATHITNNCDFEYACSTGNAGKIMTIVYAEMEKNKLYTKGAVKLKNDILRMIAGRERISSRIGQEILFFVWNSRLSGTGYAVC